MARIYKLNNGLECNVKELEKSRDRCVLALFGIGGLIVFIWLFCFRFVLSFPFLLWVLIAILLLCVVSGYNIVKRLVNIGDKINVYSAGLAGEQRTQIILLGLSDEFSIIANANIEFDGRPSELDNIVIGPSGVFIIETKNYSGTIRGDLSDKELQHVKYSAAGQEYVEFFYNPAKQVSTHTYRLKNMLKEKGINVTIYNCVFFSEKTVFLQIENQNDVQTQFFTKREDLLEYITNKSTILNNRDVSDIVNVILTSSSTATTEV